MPSNRNWRPLAHAELSDVMRIAGVAHPQLPERMEVFDEKQRLFPEGCFAFDAAGHLAGYAISHPWTLNDVPPLDSLLKALPVAPDCLYLHDVALLPQARGSGAAAGLMAMLTRLADDCGLAHLALVSVYGTDKLWRPLGFEDAGQSEKLAAYGLSARYMVRRL
ncbi:MAG: GNAT family N-acetyltransferase [Methylocystis sp.]|nr:MAG: GNAT family N-acetyltransferase [Methylocystis sp.]